MAKQSFKIGDRVTWTSHGRGVVSRKVGEVVAAVRPGEHVLDAIARVPRRRRPTNVSTYLDVSSAVRDTLSYVVNVDGKAYRPRVAGLRLAS